METLRNSLATAAHLIGGTPSATGRGTPQIEMASAEGRSIYFEFPNASDTDLGEATLHVSIDDCEIASPRYASEKRREIAAHARHALALMALRAGDPELAQAVLAADLSGRSAKVDEIAGHLANGRLADARATLEAKVLRLNKTQRDKADRVRGLELLILWPPTLGLPPQDLLPGEARDATPAERAEAERLLREDCDTHDLILLDVRVVRTLRHRALPHPGHQVHLSVIVSHRRWVGARRRGKPQPSFADVPW